jgi:hypothetical protein
LICSIAKNEDGSYSSGTYTLSAVTIHGILATNEFTVD